MDPPPSPPPFEIRVASRCENKLKRNRYHSLSRHFAVSALNETRSQGPAREESRLHLILALTEPGLE